MVEVVLSIAVSLVAFAVLLAFIVFIHEYGHFKTGRLCGMRIDTFSIGFGPALTSWRDKHGTVWKIAALPLGGFVKFFGDANAASAGVSPGEGPAEAEGPKPATTQFNSERDKLESLLTPEEKAVCFHFKPVWQRMLVIAAGPIANFLLAIVIFAGLFMAIGNRDVAPVVGAVAADSAAAEAGFEDGDKITAINGRGVKGFSDISMRVKLSSDTPLTFTVDREGEILDVVATPRRTVTTDGFGNEVRVGLLGISSVPELVTWRRYGPFEAVGAGVDQTATVIESTVRYLGRLVSFREDPRQLGGPVKIATYAGQAVKSGFDPAYEISLFDRTMMSLTVFLELAALISVSIGFMNLLPIPVLDGGHLVYYAYEAVMGRPLSDRVQGIGFRAGMAVIGSFMIFALVNDVVQLF